MMFPRRGEIFWVDLNPTIGTEINKIRPALVVSNDICNELSGTITVLPMTSLKSKKIFPYEVFVSPKDSGLKVQSKVKCNQIRAIDKRRLKQKIGALNDQIMDLVSDGIKIHLDLY